MKLITRQVDVSHICTTSLTVVDITKSASSFAERLSISTALPLNCSNILDKVSPI